MLTASSCSSMAVWLRYDDATPSRAAMSATAHDAVIALGWFQPDEIELIG